MEKLYEKLDNLKKVLDLFLDQTYETYQIITNCLLIYQIYTEILMIVRPIRRYLYKYIIPV